MKQISNKATVAIKCLFCLHLLAVVSGCGSDSGATGAVRGKVLLDGTPITTGNVITLPSNGKGANAQIQPDGTFELATVGQGARVVSGTHQVAVVAYKGEGSVANPEAPRELLIPQHYTNVETSGLTIEVVAGETKEVTLELANSK